MKETIFVLVEEKKLFFPCNYMTLGAFNNVCLFIVESVLICDITDWALTKTCLRLIEPTLDC